MLVLGILTILATVAGGEPLGASGVVTLLALVWYAVLPFNAILAVSSTKGTVFSGIFLLALLHGDFKFIG